MGVKLGLRRWWFCQMRMRLRGREFRLEEVWASVPVENHVVVGLRVM